MPGRDEFRIWPYDEPRKAPNRHRRACQYEVPIPEPLGVLDLRLDGALAALVSEVEQALMVLAVETTAERTRFSEDGMLAIHRRLLERTTMQRIAGRFRDSQNWIGGNDYTPCGADFVPPPPDLVAPLLADVCNVINGDMLPPLVQAALVHAQFETIHPFDDGNGRTGRAIVHVVLKTRGMAREWRHRSVSFSLECGRSTWRDSRTSAMTATAAWAIINLLPAHPMISAPVATALTQRSKSRVYEAVEQLIAAGVLVPLSSGKRNRWWEAAGLLDLIEQLESDVL